jgi:FHS family L-fucose permease-like MFS transporter
MRDILAAGLLNAIMFSTVFSLALNILGDATSHGTALICLAFNHNWWLNAIVLRHFGR